MKGEMKMPKKYSVSYTSGATGYGWEEDCDTIDQAIALVGDKKDNYTAQVSVYDRQLHDFIFYKFCLTYNFDTDMIFKNRKRDLRTTTRLLKA